MDEVWVIVKCVKPVILNLQSPKLNDKQIAQRKAMRNSQEPLLGSEKNDSARDSERGHTQDSEICSSENLSPCRVQPLSLQRDQDAPHVMAPAAAPRDNQDKDSYFRENWWHREVKQDTRARG